MWTRKGIQINTVSIFCLFMNIILRIFGIISAFYMVFSSFFCGKMKNTERWTILYDKLR